MKQFAQLFRQLDQTSKSTVKINALIEYFLTATDEDKVWSIALLSDKRPKRTVTTALLKEWLIELGEIPLWLFEESYRIVGDVAETIALVLPKPTKKSDKSLTEWIEIILSLKAQKENIKKEVIIDAWTSLNQDERFLFNKLITGGFRVGISQKSIVKALSKYAEVEESKITHRLMDKWHPTLVTFEELILATNPSEDHSKPYPFYLGHSLDIDCDQLGSPSDWTAERKWDGIRGQLILRGGEYYLWSIEEELISEKFPELEILKNKIDKDIVIDGEIIPYKNEKPLNYNELQTRIGRKNITKKQLIDTPVIIVAFDLIEYNGEDIREKPLHNRRNLLKEIVKDINSDRLVLSDDVEFKTWEELAKERENSRAFLSIGIMLKHLNSPYKAGRIKGDWWKWKIDPMTIEAVLIYAQRGQGRSKNPYSYFTFAVKGTDTLVPFTKAYSGLTDEELKEISQWIKKNTNEKFGPVRSVNPELVFELAFEGIAKSTRHKSGVSLRAPRINRWLKEKTLEEINTLTDLNKMLADFG